MPIYGHIWQIYCRKQLFLMMYDKEFQPQMPQNEAELTEYCQKTGHFGINIAENSQIIIKFQRNMTIYCHISENLMMHTRQK